MDVSLYVHGGTWSEHTECKSARAARAELRRMIRRDGMQSGHIRYYPSLDEEWVYRDAPVRSGR